MVYCSLHLARGRPRSTASHPYVREQNPFAAFPASGAACLAEEVDLSQIDDFVAAPAENCFEHEKAEAGHLLKADRRRHGEFLPVYRDFNQRGAVVLEGLRNHRSDLVRVFGLKECQGTIFSRTVSGLP